MIQECKTSLVSAKPAYRHVGENLYRRISSGIILYRYFQRGQAVLRRSLKTSDIALARRRLSEPARGSFQPGQSPQMQVI